jgi:LacI family transcriptional regulator
MTRGFSPLPLNPDSGISAGLLTAPRPLAVFIATDRIARRFVKLCRERDIAVPGEVAVIGADNDPLFCMQIAPQLTSVDTNGVKVGYEAAALAERMLSDPATEERQILVPPVGVIQRESTSMSAVTAPPLAKALAFIRSQESSAPTVADVAEAAGVSRRTLLVLCRTHFGTSVKDLITETRLERARNLLLNSQMTLFDLSVICGFNHYGRFSQLFHRRFGSPPARYRRQHQVG